MDDRPADTIEVVRAEESTLAAPLFRWVRYTIDGTVIATGSKRFKNRNAAMQDAYRHNPDYAECILVQPRTDW